MRGVDVVFHEAALVGVGQSMYQIERFVDVNCRGTALILDLLVNDRSIRDRVRKIIVASSMSIYGEGTYYCREHGIVFPALRLGEHLATHDWEMRCPNCDRPAAPLPTPEHKPLRPTSVYACSKRDQEELVLSVGRAYGTPAVSLRYFNTYGPYQALSNPYTGVAAIFSSRLLNGNAPVVFEDGCQSRDFVHVQDIVQANLLVMNHCGADYEAFNVGTGNAVTIAQVGEMLANTMGCELRPRITNQYRAGDIRHCFPTIEKIVALGYEPTISLDVGLAQLVDWIETQEAEDKFEMANFELATRGLAG
jgi:dTDP-L-rhamnose 4-epimerase